MKRYCFLIFLLLLSISALKAQYVDEWNYMKERYLSFLRNPDANFEELNESNNPFDLYVSCDFQVDEWQYTIISKDPILSWKRSEQTRALKLLTFCISLTAFISIWSSSIFSTVGKNS